MLFVLIGAAVGAVAGAYVAHAVGEKDQQSSEHHRQVANKLTSDYLNLQKRYDELDRTNKNYIKEQANLNQQHIHDLTKKNASDEEEKDLLRLTIRLQQSLYNLMINIDEQPTKEALIKFEQAALATNTVLFKLKEELFQVPDTYFSRNLERIQSIEGKSIGQIITGNIYPIERCQQCGTQNIIRSLKDNFDPICGKCKHRLITETTSENISQQRRASMQISARKRSVTFATYESYLNWFCRSHPSLTPFSENDFYQSTRYSHIPQVKEQKISRNNRKSSIDEFYLL